MCPKSYTLPRPGVELSPQSPRDAAVDALLLPWRESEDAIHRLLGTSAPGVLEELRGYPPGRELRMSSAGELPARFLLHLSLPADELAGGDLLLSRFSESFAHARVLGLSKIAIPLAEFASTAEDFRQLADAIWEAWNRETAARLHISILAPKGDLRREYMSRFLQRRKATALDGGEISALRSSEAEGVLRPELSGGLDLEQCLDRLLDDYREGRSLEEAMGAMERPMMQALWSALDPGERLEELPRILRILGPSIVQRLPWELLRRGSRFLGEEHLFPRGTSFFVLGGGGAAAGEEYHLRILAGEDRRGALRQELINLLNRTGKQGVFEDDGARQHSIVYSVGAEGLDRLLADPNPQGGEMVFLEGLEEEDLEEPVEEISGRLLARGYRRVLAPLAGFRDAREAQIFRLAFFEHFFRGGDAGEALHYAQRSLLEAFGLHSGWFLYRIFGQAENRSFATKSSLRQGGGLR